MRQPENDVPGVGNFTGIQGGVLAIAVATLLFGDGLTVVPAVTYSLTMYWTAFILIAYFRFKPPRLAEQ